MHEWLVGLIIRTGECWLAITVIQMRVDGLSGIIVALKVLGRALCAHVGPHHTATHGPKDLMFGTSGC
jgi:hypothetical protein